MAKKRKVSAPRPVTYDESKWRAQEDARTLVEAEKIRNDQKRMTAAAKEAKTIAEEKANEVKEMKKIARRVK